MALFTDDITINTMIGEGTKVDGDLKIVGLVRIDGDVNGNLETTGKIIIGEKARVKGNVTAQAAVIGGIVEGNVFAPEGVQLFGSSSVLGDVITQKIQMAENSIIHGMCISLKDIEEFNQALENWKTEKAILSKAAFSTGIA